MFLRADGEVEELNVNQRLAEVTAERREAAAAAAAAAGGVQIFKSATQSKLAMDQAGVTARLIYKDQTHSTAVQRNVKCGESVGSTRRLKLRPPMRTASLCRWQM